MAAHLILLDLIILIILGEEYSYSTGQETTFWQSNLAVCGVRISFSYARKGKHVLCGAINTATADGVCALERRLAAL
jgi:hypothetical protein